MSTPEDIRRVDDIVYGQNTKWQVLDLYRPANIKGSLPVIVNVHGGAWVYGSKEVYQFYCMNLAQRGFVVVNFTYRLAPRYKFPASLEDTSRVFHWLLAHSEEYGMDTKHVFAVGDSAGAHLLSLFSVLCTNVEYAGKFSFSPPAGFVPSAIALNCGIYHIDTKSGSNELRDNLVKDLLSRKGIMDQLTLITALPFITKDFPPAYVMTANRDTGIEEYHVQMLQERLTAHGITHVIKTFGDDENPLHHDFHCNIRTEAAKTCNDEECAFFREHIKYSIQK